LFVDGLMVLILCVDGAGAGALGGLQIVTSFNM
jgi:hypothetical protein